MKLALFDEMPAALTSPTASSHLTSALGSHEAIVRGGVSQRQVMESIKPFFMTQQYKSVHRLLCCNAHLASSKADRPDWLQKRR